MIGAISHDPVDHAPESLRWSSIKRDWFAFKKRRREETGTRLHREQWDKLVTGVIKLGGLKLVIRVQWNECCGPLWGNSYFVRRGESGFWIVAIGASGCNWSLMNS